MFILKISQILAAAAGIFGQHLIIRPTNIGKNGQKNDQPSGKK